MDWGAGVATVENENDYKVQGTAAWKRWRDKGLGSSDAAVLLGWSPWKKIEELWEEKLGLRKQVFGAFQQRAMDRGKDLEPVIREWYEKNCRNGVRFTEEVEEDSECTYRRASYDGINREFRNADGTVGRIIEIKAPNAKDHALAANGMLPEKYMAQVQWLMLVAKVQWCDYVSFGTDDQYHVVEVKANPAIQNELGERAHIFWQHIQTKSPVTHWDTFVEAFQSPLNLDSVILHKENVEKESVKEVPTEDPVPVVHQEVESIVAATLLAQKEADIAVGKFEALKEQLKKILGKEEKMERAQAVFGWQKRKGTVDYSVIPELIGIDLDQFRKPDTRAFYFKKVDAAKSS